MENQETAQEEKLYYAISEVAEMIGENTSLLRFWEKEFKELNPKKSKKGIRLYTKEDIELVKTIHFLTKSQGLTLEGAKATLKKDSVRPKNIQKNIETLKELRSFLLNLADRL
jgi:DNA-binding transcriptional MerR regulator